MCETNRHAIDLRQRPKEQVVAVLTWLAGVAYHPVSWLVEVVEDSHGRPSAVGPGPTGSSKDRG